MSKKSGRVIFDDRGNSHWEWLTDSGRFESDIDSKKLKTLTDASLSITGQHPKPAPGFDPYNSSNPAAPKKSPPKRKSIDDLRKLSEHIKNSKHWKNDKG